MRKFNILLFCCAYIIFSHSTYAQNNCENALYEANLNFENGNINSCIERLEGCVSKMNQAEKTETYRLLALAYLELKNENIARNNVILLLKNQPQYSLFPHVDPLSLSKLIQQYTISPRIALGMHIGMNQSFVSLIKSHSAYLSSQRYKPSIGYQIGANMDYYLNPKISINTQLYFTGIGITHEIDSASGWRQNYSEQQRYIAFNISGNYEKAFKNKIKIRLGTGIGSGYLTQSSVFIESTNMETSSKLQDAQNPTNMRFRFQPFALLSGGIYFPVEKGYFGIESSCYYFFRNTVNPENRMNDVNFNFKNQYVNDDISLRNITIFLTYKLPVSWNINLTKQ